MFCNVPRVFDNIQNGFSAHNWVFVPGWLVVWQVCGWFVVGLDGLWVVSSFTTKEI